MSSAAPGYRDEEPPRRRIHFPVGEDPFVREVMTLQQVYDYGTEHYDFHRGQLTLSTAGPPAERFPGDSAGV